MIDPEPVDETYGFPITPLTGGPDREPRAGGACPRCRKGHLDYDELLNLTCPECGYAVQGCFT